MGRFLGFSMVLGAAVGWFGAGAANANGLPQTGQTKCYDAAGAEEDCETGTVPGQDGFYGAGGCATNGVRFVDNGDGTVTDRCTGLMWSQDVDTTGDGNSDGGDLLLWCDALAFCEGLTKAGHSDWRLPNIFELESIVDRSRVNPALDPVFEVAAGGGGDGQQRTWGSHMHTRDQVAFVHFNTGAMGTWASFGGKLYNVRAVRTIYTPIIAGNGDTNGDGVIDLSDAIYELQFLFSGSDPIVPTACLLPKTGKTRCFDDGPEPSPEIDCADAGEDCFGQDGYYQKGNGGPARYIDNGDGTITDTVTGLDWTKAHVDLTGDGVIATDSSDAKDWATALAACEALDFAGHTDWRMPNVREQMSIFTHNPPDGGFSTSTLDPIFDNPPGVFSGENFIWTSTTLTALPSVAIVFGTFQKFVLPEDVNKSFLRATRACRGGVTQN